MFPSIHDAVISAIRARDHALSSVIKKTATRKTRNDISFEGGEEKKKEMLEDPF